MANPRHVKPVRLPPGEAIKSAIKLGLDKPADINSQGFGWRIAKIANSNKDSLKAAGYDTIQNNRGDWLICYNPQRTSVDV